MAESSSSFNPSFAEKLQATHIRVIELYRRLGRPTTENIELKTKLFLLERNFNSISETLETINKLTRSVNEQIEKTSVDLTEISVLLAVHDARGQSNSD